MARTTTPRRASWLRSAGPGRAGWLRAGGVGVVCLALGIVLGTALQQSRAVAAPPAREAAAVSPARVAPASFADIVDVARPGVVSVRALLRAEPVSEGPVPEVPGAAAPARTSGDPVTVAAPPPEASDAEPVAAAPGQRTADLPESRQGPQPGAERVAAMNVQPAAVAAARGGSAEPTTLAGFVGERNGSGFIVDPRGLVVTSRHVVVDAARIDVFVPGLGRYEARLAGEDEATDLAILRLKRPPAGLPALPLGASERLRAGDWIVAVGNPFGFAQTVTAGVVSFVGRHLPHTDLGVTSDFVQISAPLNPGSSGCPVLDLDGRVVGVTTKAAADAQGISFAVPSRTLKWALAEMERAEDGVVRRGYLGIEFATSRRVDDRGEPRGGARIVRVVSGAPAEAAGIRTGDVVLAVDGIPVADAAVLHQRIVQGRPGGKIALQVLRDERVLGPIEARLSEMGQARATRLN
ncbi:MAG: trypsin-like peptidase domain-containing protein [bacterium]|nr:trypsin-like peptidase domain-containing protein [bacterium]